MEINNDFNNKFYYYFLAIVGSFSTAGAMMTLLALSANFYLYDQEGIFSSSIYVLNYLGIAVIGFFGGWILHHFNAINLGIIGSLLSSAIVLYLATFYLVPPYIGLPAIFVIFLLNGIDHPNSLRFFNEVINEQDKMAFFSIKEGSSYLIGIITPVLAALIIKFWGARTCFFIDGIICLFACLPWFILKKNKKQFTSTLQKNINYFDGFKLILTDPCIRKLNVSRFLNNLAYVTWTTALPFLLAKTADGNTDVFAQNQGISTSLVSIGFLLASLLGIWQAKKQKTMKILVWSSSFFGFSSAILLSLSLFYNEMLYISAFFLGIGTYCFRISGMTLGQAFTPKTMLGAVIIAGDTLVRGWSFLISLSVIGIFSLHETGELSLKMLCLLVIIIPGFSVISPFILSELANIFVERNEKSNSPS